MAGQAEFDSLFYGALAGKPGFSGGSPRPDLAEAFLKSIINKDGGDAARNVFAGAEANASKVGGDVEPAPDDASEALRKALTSQMTEEVQPEKLGLGRRLALALANAGSAYAAGINSNVRQQDFIEPLRALRERRAQRETGRRQAAARTGLDSLNREEAIRTRASERGEDRAFAEEQAGLNRDARAEQDRLNREAAERNQQAIRDLREDLHAAGIESNERIAGMNDTLRRDIAGQAQEARDAALSESDKKLERGIRTQMRQSLRGDSISGVSPLAERLASGEVEVDLIREDMQDLIGDETMSPQTRERLLKFYLRNVEPVLQNHERNSGPLEGPVEPPAPSPFSGAGAEKLRNAPTESKVLGVLGGLAPKGTLDILKILQGLPDDGGRRNPLE